MADPSRTRRDVARALAPLLLAGPALLAPALAGATTKPPGIEKSPRLWATVNVCDTKAHPDTIGIRASMPGSGVRQERMYMRFKLQFVGTDDGKWHDLGADGDSGFVSVGSAKYVRREGGWNFRLDPPAGVSYQLRGVVTFEWRRNAEVVRRAVKRTRSGHAGTTGADPKTFSAAECTVKA
jgi:hypothetical protein